MAMPLILKDPPENLIAQAQSGSGKTVAFCLGILNRIDTSRDYPQAIVVTPTRELAVQCYEQTLLPLGQFMQPKLKVSKLLIQRLLHLRVNL
jgi:ATP-dependent RNA helicase DDX19/DBP5